MEKLFCYLFALFRRTCVSSRARSTPLPRRDPKTATKYVGNWQISHVSEPPRFMLYAKAYLDSSQALCREMLDDERKKTWPNASVVLLLAAHSLELFLKGAILSRDPRAKVAHHRIKNLVEHYQALFTEPEYAIDVPFQTEYPDIFDEEIEALKKQEPVPSLLFRYPIAQPGVEWMGIYALEPITFMDVLANLEEMYDRTQSAI